MLPTEEAVAQDKGLPEMLPCLPDPGMVTLSRGLALSEVILRKKKKNPALKSEASISVPEIFPLKSANQ